MPPLASRHSTKLDALPTDLREDVELTDRENVVLTPALEEEVAGRFLAALAPLEQAGRLGALLLQMPPAFSPRTADLSAIEPLLRQLKGRGKQPRKVVLELRHHDWLNAQHREATTAFLREESVPLVSIDGPPADAKHFTIIPSLDEITNPRLAYLPLYSHQ